MWVEEQYYYTTFIITLCYMHSVVVILFEKKDLDLVFNLLNVEWKSNSVNLNHDFNNKSKCHILPHHFCTHQLRRTDIRERFDLHHPLI